jgi:hypothetical protein
MGLDDAIGLPFVSIRRCHAVHIRKGASVNSVRSILVGMIVASSLPVFGAQSAQAASTDFVFSWEDTNSANTRLVLPIDLRTPGGAVVDCGSGITGIRGDLASPPANALFTVCDYGLTAAGLRLITVSNPSNMTYTGNFCSAGTPDNTSCSNAAARNISQWGGFTFRGAGYFMLHQA